MHFLHRHLYGNADWHNATPGPLDREPDALTTTPPHDYVTVAREASPPSRAAPPWSPWCTSPCVAAASDRPSPCRRSPRPDRPRSAAGGVCCGRPPARWATADCPSMTSSVDSPNGSSSSAAASGCRQNQARSEYNALEFVLVFFF